MKLTLKNITKFSLSLVCLAALNLSAAPVTKLAAQNNVLATINFDPKTDGFGFENYGNSNRQWQNDLTAEDMIKLFGAKAVCVSGETPQNCVLKAPASEWMNKQLKGMDGGHCEGMAAAAARLKFNKPFKTKDGSPASFQPGISRVFDLKLDGGLGNYIAYYWITQNFDEVANPSTQISAGGPAALVNALVAGMKAGETYTVGVEKYDRATGKKSEGHAVTAIAVEDAGDKFVIKIYDNNFPGETRDITVEKGGKQTWRYSTTTKPGEPVSEYTGDTDTKTLVIVPNSNRDKNCFEAPFAAQDAEKQCAGATAAVFPNVLEINDPAAYADARFLINNEISPVINRFAGDRAEFFLNNDSNLLVTAPDGKRLGYDPATNKFYEEISGGRAGRLKGGRGETLPNYSVPAQTSGGAYKLTFSGKDLNEESTTDFVYSAPGLTVGFDGVQLDPNETLNTTISPDGETITFTSSADGETPGIFFAFAPKNGAGTNYLVRVSGAQIEAGKTLTAHFDFENHKVSFKDDDGNSDEYSVEVIRINPDGTQQKLKKEFKEDGGEIESDLDEWTN